jgi:glycosyltransferase involved in cell wall biosynthesis
MTLPAVTAIVCTHNRPKMMREAVAAIVNQDYWGQIDVVVVFDKTEPDGSIEMTSDNRSVSVMSNQLKPGLAGGRNTGIAAATGDYIAFCDDDDQWLPNKLTAQIELLEARPEIHTAVCGLEIIYDNKTVVRILESDLLEFDDFLLDRIMEAHPSTVVFRRSVAQEIGPVDQDLPGGYYEDYEWLLRASKVSAIASVNRPLVKILWGGTSYYTGKFEMIESAITHLLAQWPEFDAVPKGKARLLGQIAFAQAGQKKRLAAAKTALATIKLDFKQPRAYLALVAATGLVSANKILAELNKRGRGL